MNFRHMVSGAVSPSLRASYIALEDRFTQALRSLGVGALVRRRFLRPLLEIPHEIDIEVTSSCDADCVMCPRKAMRRKAGPMEFGLFAKIVDEAVELGVPRLVLNGYGEFSTLKGSDDYLAYIRAKSPNIHVVVNTNGMRMNEALVRSYIKHRVDVLNITIDGATAPVFESIRKKLSLATVEGNVMQLLRIRSELGSKFPLVGVFMIVMPQNKHEAELFLKKWQGVADSVSLTGLLSRIDSIEFAKAQDNNWEATPCFHLWQQMPILSDGTVALCCDDWDGRGGLGNANTMTIKALWSDPKRKKFRDLHLASKASAISLCNDCRQPRKGPWWFQIPDSQSVISPESLSEQPE